MAYQGKFSAKNRQPRSYDEDIQVTSRKAEAPKKDIYEDPTPVKRAPRRDAYEEETAVKQPAKTTSKKPSKKKKKKANPTVTAIFYTLYFLMIIGFFGGMFFVTEWLDGWLVDYEASQPTAKCEEVFNKLFSDPDWAAIYESAGLTDTDFEGVDAYVAYMEQKMQGNELTYAETSAGLTGGHKYLVKLGDETIGYFTLTDQSENLTDLPDWQLGEVVMNVTRNESVLIRSVEGHTVTVNGTELDESHTIEISTTLAEEYLPAGTSGLRMCLQQVEDLMTEPEIVITDESGNVSTVVYNTETGVYEEQTSATTIGPDEKERAQKTAETYGLYMIAKADSSTLAKYFDSSSQIYKTITSMQLWMQSNRGYEFANQTVSEYCSYGEDLFSARVSLSLNVTRGDGSVKEYTVDQTFFFEMQGGSWKCFDMTNVDIQEAVSTVRITFKNGDTVLDSRFYDSDASELTAPVITPPEGKILAGWYKETVKSDGTKSNDLVFTPEADGTVTIPAGTTLEPMTLYPWFDDASGGTE